MCFETINFQCSYSNEQKQNEQNGFRFVTTFVLSTSFEHWKSFILSHLNFKKHLVTFMGKQMEIRTQVKLTAAACGIFGSPIGATHMGRGDLSIPFPYKHENTGLVWYWNNQSQTWSSNLSSCILFYLRFILNPREEFGLLRLRNWTQSKNQKISNSFKWQQNTSSNQHDNHWLLMWAPRH